MNKESWITDDDIENQWENLIKVQQSDMKRRSLDVKRVLSVDEVGCYENQWEILSDKQQDQIALRNDLQGEEIREKKKNVLEHRKNAQNKMLAYAKNENIITSPHHDTWYKILNQNTDINDH